MANEAALPPVEILSEDKKGDIRNKVWTYLQKNKLASFPYPPFRRIPNFVASQETCAKISEFPEFSAAKCIKIDPDKPLQEARYQTLKAGKTLLVPTPRLIYNFLNEISPPADGDDEILKTCASQKGVLNYSKSLELDALKKVDLIIVGAVAVTASGWRIGKGAGYSDLEYAMMLNLGIVDANTKIVAVVHDCQVLDLQQSLFEPHDVPVDVIVTPTRIIDCSKTAGGVPRSRPNGIFWNLLDEDRLKMIPILRSIRYTEWKKGKNVALKGEEGNPVELKPEDMSALKQEADEARKKSLENNGRRGRPFGRGRGNRRDNNRRRENKEEGGEGGKQENNKDDRAPRRGRGGRRFFGQPRRRVDSAKKDEIKENGLGGGDAGEAKRSDRKRQDDRPGKDGNDGKGRDNKFRKWGRYRLKGKLFVGKIPRFVRVSEFKNEVREAAKSTEAFLVRVDWFGSNGFAFLNYETAKEAEAVLAALEGLTIKDKPIFVEMARERKRTRSGSSTKRKDTEDGGKQVEQPVV